MPIPKPPYPAAFRQQMVELVQAGRKPSELAKEFGCHVTSILTWVRHAGVTTPVTTQGAANAALSAAEREELLELRRKFRQVQMERDILAKATAWFAHNGAPTSTPSTR
jgi:transposase